MFKTLREIEKIVCNMLKMKILTKNQICQKTGVSPEQIAQSERRKDKLS